MCIVVTDWCCLIRYDSIWLNKQHVILVFSLNDSQHVTAADYSVETIQSTITRADISGIDQETRSMKQHRCLLLLPYVVVNQPRMSQKKRARNKPNV